MAADPELNVELEVDPELYKLLDVLPTKKSEKPGSKRKLYHEQAEKASKKTRAETEKPQEEASSSSSVSSKVVAAAEATRILNEQKYQNRRAQGVAGRDLVGRTKGPERAQHLPKVSENQHKKDLKRTGRTEAGALKTRPHIFCQHVVD